MTSQENVI